MPLIVAALAIGALALYGWLCYLMVVYVVVPVLPWVVAGGVVIGVLLTVVVLVGTLVGVAGFAPVTVTPADVSTRLPRRKKSPFPRDDAWPNYLFAQARTDLTTAFERCFRVVGAVWVFCGSIVAEAPIVLVGWAILLLPFVLLVVTSLSVVGSVLAAGALTVGTLLVAALGWLAACGLLRGLDLGVRRLRRAKSTCHHPRCNERSMLPAFRCPKCGEIHHDIRAGRQGAFFRRCGCDQLLTTTVLRAATGMVAVCQRCGRPLHSGSAVLTNVVVPVFGPASAGKTRFVYAGMVALARHLAALGGTLRAVGQESEATFAEAQTIIDTGRQTAKTREGPAAAITVRVGTGRRKAMLYLYDAAGESFGDRAKTVELTHLADTEGLVFILDPFSIPEVVSELRADRSALDDAQPAHLDPELAYLITVQWLGDQQVPLARMPLAVAVVKADLLRELHPGTGLDPDATSEDIEQWLLSKRVDNFVEGAKRDFGEVRFFLVSSLDDISTLDGRASPTSPARPLLWLLERSGMTVQQEKEPVAS
jgi:Double-GTPase 2